MKKFRNYNYAVTRDGRVYSFISDKFIKSSKNNSGYEGVTLYSNGVSSSYLVHRMVAEVYLENPHDYPCVNHLDGDKDNNNVSNLEWCTYSENNNHALSTGLRDVSNSLVYEDTLTHKIFQAVMDGWRLIDIAETYGLSKSNVRHILYSGHYDHIKSDYDWDNRPNKSESISTERAIWVCECLQEGLPLSKISQVTGVSVNKIKNIKYRISFRKISDNFKF